VTTGPKGTWDENLLVTTSYAMLEVGDEVRIYYFGCPNVFRNWPGGFGPAHRRGSRFYSTYLGLATLPVDRYGYAQGAGAVTTHPIDLRDGELWLNADGPDLQIKAGDATGTLGPQRRRTVYRKVIWSAGPPHGRHRVEIALSSESDRLYSVAC
jgi:hypothetical protein